MSGTQWSCSCPADSPALPTTHMHTQSTCQDRVETVPLKLRFAPADGKPQQWSLWWPVFPLISWLMYREKSGPSETIWIPARLPNLTEYRSCAMFSSVQYAVFSVGDVNEVYAISGHE